MQESSYSAFSLGSRTFSTMATMAAGTMPEPPKISLMASGAKFRMAVLAPILEILFLFFRNLLTIMKNCDILKKHVEVFL